jgi:hypothetical protein
MMHHLKLSQKSKQQTCQKHLNHRIPFDLGFIETPIEIDYSTQQTTAKREKKVVPMSNNNIITTKTKK